MDHETWIRQAAASTPQPNEALSIIGYVVQGTVLVLATIFVVLRLYSKHYILHSVDLQDLACIMSYIFILAYCISGTLYVYNGGGLHFDELEPYQVVPVLKCIWALMVIYTLLVFSIKVLLLSMLIRVFGPQKKAVLCIKIFLGIVVAYYTIGTIIRIRICWPPSAYWMGEMDKCLDIFAIFVVDSAISIVTDGVILLLPFFLTRSLQMPTIQKLRIAGILGAGGLATVSNIYRMILLYEQGRSADVTNFIVKLLLTGNAESCIGFICACLPPVNALISKTIRQYSSRRKNQTDYEMDSHPYSRQYSRQMQGSKARDPFPLTQHGVGEDKEMLVRNAQEIPTTRFETSITPSTPTSQSDGDGGGPRDFIGGRGIMKTVSMTHTFAYMGSNRS